MLRREFLASFVAACAMPALSAERPKVVITGHLGNIGSRLFPYFPDAVGIDKKDGPEWDLGFDMLPWQGAISGASVVIHLAATAGIGGSDFDYQHNNVLATRNLIGACIRHRIPHFVFASSTWADPYRYGRPGFDGKGYWRCDEKPLNQYGRSKRLGEGLVSHFGSYSGRCGVSVRIGWAPPLFTPRADEWSESIRHTTGELVSAFAEASTRAPGYHLVEMVQQQRKCS